MMLAFFASTLAMMLGHQARTMAAAGSEDLLLSPIWPATGVNIALIWLWGMRIWPGVLAASILTNLAAFGSWKILAAGAPADVIEPLVAVWLMRSSPYTRAPQLATRRAALGLLAAGLAGPLTGIAAAQTVFRILGQPIDGHGIVTWCIADALAAITITPVVITSLEHQPVPWTTRPRLQAVLITLGLACCCAWLFLDQTFVRWLRPEPLVFLPLPFIVWSALAFGAWGASWCNLAVAVVAVVGTLRRHGPFASSDPIQDLLLLQIYLGVSGVVSLLLGAATCARADAHRAQTAQTEHIRMLLNELDHRVRNNLTSLLTLSQLMLSAVGTSTFNRHATGFEARVRAMAKVHSILSRLKWTPAPLSTIISGVVAAECPRGAEGVQISGDDPSVPAEYCQPLALALHEMARNTAQHGIWSNDPGAASGTLKVHARIVEEGLHLTWDEVAPEGLDAQVDRGSFLREGLGLSLARGFIVHELAGKLEYSLEDRGFHAQLMIPGDWKLNTSAASEADAAGASQAISTVVATVHMRVRPAAPSPPVHGCPPK